MGQKIIRFMDNEMVPKWGRLSTDHIEVFTQQPENLGALLQVLSPSVKVESTVSLSSVSLLSPVTAPCQVICQGKNYLDHILETGVNPKDKDFNLLFSKAPSSLTAPIGTVLCPSRVSLFDYELELGLIIRKRVSGPVNVTKDNLFDYVAGIVMANDLSARDVQVPERQWLKGKSFRGFCPVGPWIWLWDQSEVNELRDLNLVLKVNGEVRQKGSTKQLIYSPEETLTEISQIFDLWPGDLVLTGTPGGVAMKVKPKTFQEEFHQLRWSEKDKFKEFIREQSKSTGYLKAEDEIRSTIVSEKGKIDLGEQILKVEKEEA